MKCIVWMGVALAAVWPAIANAQEMALMPDYVGQNAYRSTQDSILESAQPGAHMARNRPQAVTGASAAATRQSRSLDPHRQAQVQRYMQSLRAEYERRVARDGRASADAWLRGVASELGRQAGLAERERRLRARSR